LSLKWTSGGVMYGESSDNDKWCNMMRVKKGDWSRRPDKIWVGKFIAEDKVWCVQKWATGDFKSVTSDWSRRQCRSVLWGGSVELKLSEGTAVNPLTLWPRLDRETTPLLWHGYVYLSYECSLVSGLQQSSQQWHAVFNDKQIAHNVMYYLRFC